MAIWVLLINALLGFLGEADICPVSVTIQLWGPRACKAQGAQGPFGREGPKDPRAQGAERDPKAQGLQGLNPRCQV